MKLRWLHTWNQGAGEAQEALSAEGWHTPCSAARDKGTPCLSGGAGGKDRVGTSKLPGLALKLPCKDGFSGLKWQDRNLQPSPQLSHCSV